MHCASLGEAKGLWALVAHLPAEVEEVVVTANTSAGVAYLEVRCRSLGVTGGKGKRPRARAAMAPFDHPSVVGAFLERGRIKALCLYEAELWPNWLRACASRGVPVALVSARLDARAERRLAPIRGAFSGLLAGLAWMQAQGEEDLRRYRRLAPVRAGSGFDFKAARLLDKFPRPADSPPGPRFAFLSLHLKELRWLLPGLIGLMERFPLTIFPRHLEELPGFRARLEPLGFGLHSRAPGARHLLVDAHGLVEGMLPACHSALVGGSLIPAGCHNLWEPLAAGLKIYFGPFYHKQASLAGLLLEKGLAEVLRDRGQMEKWREPVAGLRAACGALLLEQREALERALWDFQSRIRSIYIANF